MYTIGEVAARSGLSISTLRYYDRLGLLPGIERESGKRRFSERDLEAIDVILCLKRSGMSIEEISQFMEWCREGSKTYPKRLNMFMEQKAAIQEQIKELQRVEALIDFKIWYYQMACETGSEEEVRSLLNEGRLPDEIQAAYDRGFQICSTLRQEENAGKVNRNSIDRTKAADQGESE